MTGEEPFSVRSAERQRRPVPDPAAEETAFGVRTLVLTIFAVKLATVVIIFVAASSSTTAAILAMTTWFWVPVAVALGGGALAFRYRLLRVRAKRERLRRAEWLLDERPHVPSSTRDTVARETKT